MPNNPLFHPVIDQMHTVNLSDQIQIALAIADTSMLKALLVNCIPALAEWRHIGSITTALSVPTGNQQAADGVLHFESIRCLLANRPIELQPESSGWTKDSRELARLTQHESEMQTLGQNLPLAPLVSLLAASGFCPKQIGEILRLPREGLYKSWWYAIDHEGNFTIPFLRHIRILRYPDGTYTIQYQDFFEQDKPPCFTSQSQKVLVAIKANEQRFSETLKQINYQREALDTPQAILICDTISELEAQGFISQGISVYPAVELVLPIRADCTACGRKECPMNGVADSNVVMCHGFLPESEYV